MILPERMTQQGDEAALLAHLSSTIGNDVEQAMGAIDWEHSQSTPQVPVPPSGQEPVANPTAPAPSDAPNVPTPVKTTTELNWDEFKDASGLILGKYKDPGAATKGMHSLLQMAKTALTERDQALAEVTRYKTNPAPTPAVPEPIVIADQEHPLLKSILDKVSGGEGVDAEDIPLLIKGIQEQTEQKARAIVREQENAKRLEDEKWNKVDDYLRTHHEQALKHVNEMELFKSTNQEVGRIYNRLLSSGDNSAELDAVLFLWKEYSRENPHVMEAPVDPAVLAEQQRLAAEVAAREAQLNQERRDAGALGGSAGGPYESAAALPASDEQLKQAIAQRTFDNGQAWRNLAISPLLTHPIFNSD